MIKKLGLTTITLSLLLLSSCGSSKSTPTLTSQMKHKDKILIVHNTKAEYCTILANSARSAGRKDVLIDTPANTVNCATYGRKNADIDDAYNCIESSLAYKAEREEDISRYEDNATACVIGENQK